MSISSSTRKAGPFACNGSTVAFPFSFKVFAAADVRVVLTDANEAESDLVLGTNYTVALNADQDANPGGTVTTVATYATGYLITLTSQVQNLQPVTLTNQGGFYPKVINTALDRLTILVQQVVEQVGRAVKTPISSGLTPDQLVADLYAVEVNAGNSAAAAANSAANAAASAAAAAAVLDNFDDRYLGEKTSDPTLDNDGNPLATGALYFNTVSGVMRVYSGTGWIDAAMGVNSDDVAYQAPVAGAASRTVQDKLHESISVKDFGAKGDGVANDTSAIQSALNSGATAIFFPAGTYNISGITVPSTIKAFYGAGEATKLVGTGSPAAYTPFINFNSLNGFDVRGFSVSVNKTTYPTNHALQFGLCQSGRVRDIHVIAGGYIAVYAPGCVAVSFENIQIDAFAARGFLADTSPAQLLLDDIRVLSKGTTHSIQIIGGDRHKITRCSTYQSPSGSFGINLWNCNDSIISLNNCHADNVEGINIQDCNKVSITGNTIYCLTGHHDFGISIYAQTADVIHCLVEGNRVYYSGKSGIALASSPTKNCRLNHITGNIVVSPNQLNESQGAGILLYGGTTCSENTVQGNRLLDEGSTMKYGVNEWNDGNGNPQFNYIIDNPVLTASGLVAQNNLLTTNSQAWDIAKTTFTPAISATTGSITTASASGSYQRRGKFLHIDLSITVTTNGTGAGAVVASIPFTCVNGVLNGRENTTSGVQVTGVTSGSNVLIRAYNNSYPAANGSTFQLSGILELQ